MLFIPWYMVIDKDMRLDELIENHRLDTSLSHLDDWLRAPSGRGWGFERYGVMLRLYIWIGLALARRYPDRMAGQAIRLDRAFARLDVGENESEEAIARRADSIRRTRAEMIRRLGRSQSGRLSRASSRSRRAADPYSPCKRSDRGSDRCSRPIGSS